MSPFGLSKSLDISQKMAKTYIDNYFSRYSGVKHFIDETIAKAHDTKQTSTLLGRIRLLPEIASSNRNVRMFAERIAVNTPIQGTAADLIKLAMIQMAAALKSEGLQAVMLLSVHDEIVFEAPPEELTALVAGIRRVEQALGNGVKVSKPSEANTRSVARRSLFLRDALPAGQGIEADQLIALRPAGVDEPDSGHLHLLSTGI